MTLTRKQQDILTQIPVEWENVKDSPESKPLKQLEKRGLIELRIDPALNPQTAMVHTLLGDISIWQVRRKVQS